MSLNIKNAAAEELARQLARATGESITSAVMRAVQERLDRVRAEQGPVAHERAVRMRDIVRDAAPRWQEPYRTADHGDLLYDDAGLPR